LVIRHGEIIRAGEVRATAAVDLASLPGGAGLSENMRLDRGRYDALRVLIGELRRIVRQGRPVWIHFSPGCAWHPQKVGDLLGERSRPNRKIAFPVPG